MQTGPRQFIFQLNKSSGKGTEGKPEEGINKHWQAEKLFLGGPNVMVKFLARHIS